MIYTDEHDERGKIRLGSFMGTINGVYMNKPGPSEAQKGSKKKNILRARARAHKKNVRKSIVFKRRRSGALRRTRYVKSKRGLYMGVYSMNIHRRLKKLQTLIPGGRTVREVDVLFKETADYIVSLKMQVCLLQALSHLCSSSA